MPILIQPGAPGTLVGPGVHLHAVSDLVGPIPNDSQWQVSVYRDTELGENGKISYEHRPCVPPLQVDWRLMVPEAGKTIEDRPATAAEAGTVQVLVEIRSPSLGHQDTSDFTPFVWTNENLGVQIQDTSQAEAHGLTTEEHGWLDQVQQFVSNTLTFGGTIATQLGAGGLVDHPDLNLLSLCDAPIPIEGTGSLTRPRPGVGVEAYGLTFTITDFPPGAGLVNGVVREFSVRSVQLIAFHRSASSSDEFPVEVFDTHQDNGTWLWKDPFPSRIVYSVTPGFAAQVTWLCLPVF